MFTGILKAEFLKGVGQTEGVAKLKMCAAWLRVVPNKPGAMRADSASHLLRQPVSFELFFFTYLVCALLLQKINIYKTVSKLL